MIGIGFPKDNEQFTNAVQEAQTELREPSIENSKKKCR